MLPSRGICRGCISKTSGRELFSQSSSPNRRFSSIPSPNLTSPQYRPASPGLQFANSFRPNIWTRKCLAARTGLSSIPQARYQSTSQVGPYNTPLPPTDFASSTPDLLPDVGGEALLNATGGANGPWEIGYLRELGLDFGWGFTSSLQYIFEHIHVYGGATIGGSIIMTAVLIRLCTFPTVVRAQDTSAKLNALKDITAPIQARLRQAAQTRDQMAMQLAKQEMQQVYKTANIKLWNAFLPMIQIPIGFGLWRLMRNMADIQVPGMATGGFLWFPNLLVPDPYFVLPLATGLIQHMSIRLGGEQGTSTELSKKMRTIFLYVLPVAAPIFIGLAPAAVQITFCTASILSFCTTTLLRQPMARRLFRLPPIIRRATTPAEATPYRGTITVTGRASSHPTNAKTANPGTAARPGVVDKLNRFKPSSIRAGAGDVWKSMTEFVGNTMPQAKKTVQSRKQKAVQSRADDYEVKRSKEIEKQRQVWENEKMSALGRKGSKGRR